MLKIKSNTPRPTANPLSYGSYKETTRLAQWSQFFSHEIHPKTIIIPNPTNIQIN
jgi:hypothetical protein